MSIESFIQKYSNVTEEYKFYNGEITLRFDKKNHKYLLVTSDGLEEQDGCTSVCHIIDKSQVLMAWACKVMAQKLLDHAERNKTDIEGVKDCVSWSYQDFEKLVLEAKKAKDEKLEDAGAVGNVAHNWIEKYIKAELAGSTEYPAMPEEPRANSCCQAMLNWSTAHNVRYVLTERKVYSRKHKYAGTMDGLAYIDSCSDPKCCPRPFKDRLSVVDWKTSNNLYIEYLFQTAAYQYAYNEEVKFENLQLVVCDPSYDKPKAVDRWVIRLGKDDAKFEPWHLEQETTEEDLEGFLTCLKLTRIVADVEARVKAKADGERAMRKAEKRVAKEAKDALKAEEKARVKVEKQWARVEALRLACKASEKYQGKRKPSCKTNNDGPCVACTAKYNEKHKNIIYTRMNDLHVLELLK